jgi:hypothetical protein
MPYVWVKPFATSLALYRSIDPSALYFIENTHLHPTIFFPSGNGTNFQVLFFYKASSSSCIARVHSGSDNASSTLLGIWQEDSV